MKKLLFILGLMGLCLTASAQVTAPTGATTPQTSTSENPVWYGMMSSHLTESARQNRWMSYDGSSFVTIQNTSGLGSVSDVTQYAWRLEDNGDGYVRIVHYTGYEVYVPSGASAAADNSTPLEMTGSGNGSRWELMTAASTGLSNQTANYQYVLDYVDYTGSHDYAFLNAADSSSGYVLLLYELGVHQASGWFFVELDIDDQGGSGSEGGNEGGNESTIVGDGTYIVDDPFETMIRLGRMSSPNPIYAQPAGTAGTAYVTNAVTSGDAVYYPLSYSASSGSTTNIVIVSKQTSLVTRDGIFNLVVTTNNNPANFSVTTWTDWDRDGTFDKATNDPEISGNTITQQLYIPADAQLGKTRVRMRLETSTPSSADAGLGTGRTYDFVIYVLEGEEHDDCYISVTSSNTQYGTVYIDTDPKENGRYDVGTEITVIAVPNEDYEKEVTFNGWLLEGDTVSTETSYTFTVEKSVSLIAMFSVPAPVAPTVSTADNPVWYQIKNAHTDATRVDRYIAYDTETDATYTTALRAEKPADTTDKFLWRLEDAGDEMVYIVSKVNGQAIYGPAQMYTAFYLADTGARFLIQNSGAENESWTLMYEGNSSLMLNAADQSWWIVVYNGGIGTGSGWYFYEVDTGETEPEEPEPDPGSGINTNDAQGKPAATFTDSHINITNLPAPCSIKVYNLSGQLMVAFNTNNDTERIKMNSTESFALVVVQPSNGGEKTVIKCIENK